MTEDIFKGGVHATLASGLAVLAAYNAMRWLAAGRWRNGMNLLIYAPLLLLEWHQARRHWAGHDD